jgi:hypothetical protein
MVMHRTRPGLRAGARKGTGQGGAGKLTARHATNALRDMTSQEMWFVARAITCALSWVFVCISQLFLMLGHPVLCCQGRPWPPHACMRAHLPSSECR